MSESNETKPPLSQHLRFYAVVLLVAGVLLFEIGVGLRMVWRIWQGETPPPVPRLQAAPPSAKPVRTEPAPEAPPIADPAPRGGSTGVQPSRSDRARMPANPAEPGI